MRSIKQPQEEMARIIEDKPTYYGPISTTANPYYLKRKVDMDEQELSEERIILPQRKEYKSLTKRGYTRVQEKIREICQIFGLDPDVKVKVSPVEVAEQYNRFKLQPGKSYKWAEISNLIRP